MQSLFPNEMNDNKAHVTMLTPLSLSFYSCDEGFLLKSFFKVFYYLKTIYIIIVIFSNQMNQKKTLILNVSFVKDLIP